MNKDTHSNALQPDHHLLWYVIKQVLGQGAFGITYLAYDINLDRLVAIKEYMPGHLAMRGPNLQVRPVSAEHEDDFRFGLSRFISEARTLTRFEHPHLIRVFNAFEANNTAYMVMNYEVGESLHAIIKRRKILNEEELMKLVLPLLEGLQKMHAQGFIHRDIKPGNIFIRKSDGGPVLLDFGSARQTRHNRAQTLTTLVSPGYAPIEQYSSNSDKQGPWTDIYGLGATIYKIITGTPPVNAVDRGEAIMHDGKDCYVPLTQQTGLQYSPAFLAAIDHALAFTSSNRPQSVSDWKTEFPASAELILTESGLAVSGGTQAPGTDEKTTEIHEDAGTYIKTQQIQPEDATFEKTINLNPEPALAEKSAPATAAAKTKKIYLRAAVVVMVVIIVAGIALLRQGGRENTEMPTPEPAVGPAAAPGSLAPDTTAPDTAAPDTTAAQTGPADEGGEVTEQTGSAENPEIAQLLEQADNSIRELRLTSPAGNNAYEQYQQVLALEPANEKAKAGLRTVSDKYIALAYGAMDSDNIEKAELYIRKASDIWPDSDKIPPARKALQTRKDEIAQRKENAPTEEVATSGTTATPATETGEDETDESFVGGVKKWFKENAEKNKDAGQQQGTGSEFVKSIGGPK